MAEQSVDSTVVGEVPPEVGSPPVAPRPERRETDPRARLHELAIQLLRTQNRRLLIEYLQLRRAGR